VVSAADFATLPVVPARSIGVEGELVKAPRYRVSFDPYGRHGPRVQDVRGCHQHPQRSGGWNDNTVVTIEQTIGRLSYISVIVCV